VANQVGYGICWGRGNITLAEAPRIRGAAYPRFLAALIYQSQGTISNMKLKWNLLAKGVRQKDG
jgi:hypothetical protein